MKLFSNPAILANVLRLTSQHENLHAYYNKDIEIIVLMGHY